MAWLNLRADIEDMFARMIVPQMKAGTWIKAEAALAWVGAKPKREIGTYEQRWSRYWEKKHKRLSAGNSRFRRTA